MTTTTMKSLVCILVLVHVAYGKLLPDYVSKYTCSRSDPSFNDCMLDNLNKIIPDIFPKGIPEVELPVMDPWVIPFMSVDGNLATVQVKMIMKNITLVGASQATIKSFKLDPVSMAGEIVFNVPYLRMMTEYYATGRLFVIPLESNAFFDGNFTGFDGVLKFSLKTVERKGVKYFSMDKTAFKGRLETAHIKLTSVNPAQQAAVNVLQNFFNENDRLVLDTVNPLFRSTGATFYKQIAEKGLRVIPAEELIPY